MDKIKNILITGGSGFIGSTLIDRLLKNTKNNIFNIDFLGYASDIFRLEKFKKDYENYQHLNIDISDNLSVQKAVSDINPDLIFHLAAESHVDRSIESPMNFVKSNIVGTFNLLEAATKHFSKLSIQRKTNFRFHHISTDEVFGSLTHEGKFDENSNYQPNSPYSATKASSDHLVRAWFHSYSLPILITNCSNNYGPFQFPEKLIPLTIVKAINGKSIPIYGDGENIRDWLHVEDHIAALLVVANSGVVGSTYCIGGNSEIKNIDLVKTICNYLDQNHPKNNGSYLNQIEFVKDRPGHDYRYAIDTNRIESELRWKAKIPFKEGIKKTVDWYVNNQNWIKYTVKNSGYKGERLGLII